MRIRSTPTKGTTVLVRLPVSPTFRVTGETQPAPPPQRKARGRDDRQATLPGI